MYARVLQATAQFVLKIAKLSHIELARVYGLPSLIMAPEWTYYILFANYTKNIFPKPRVLQIEEQFLSYLTLTSNTNTKDIYLPNKCFY